MRVLSLFDGISCGRLALQKAGYSVESYIASEIDKYSISVSNAYWKDIIQVGDIRGLDYNKGDFDLIMGGSPCQGLSFANTNRLNLGDSRSSLFFEFLRLKNTIKPSYFLLENVVCDEGTENKISDLLEVTPIAINSKVFSAQSRKRLYWTNIPYNRIPEVKNIVLEDIMIDNYDKAPVAVPTTTLREVVNNLSSSRLDYARLIGKIGLGRQGERIYDPSGKSAPLLHTGGGKAGPGGSLIYDKAIDSIRKLHLVEVLRLQNLPDDYIGDSISPSRAISCIGNGWTVDVISHLLGGMR